MESEHDSPRKVSARLDWTEFMDMDILAWVWALEFGVNDLLHEGD